MKAKLSGRIIHHIITIARRGDLSFATKFAEEYLDREHPLYQRLVMINSTHRPLMQKQAKKLPFCGTEREAGLYKDRAGVRHKRMRIARNFSRS